MNKDNSTDLNQKYKPLLKFKGVLSFIIFCLLIGGAIATYIVVTHADCGEPECMLFVIIGIICLLFQIYVISNIIRIIEFLFELNNQ